MVRVNDQELSILATPLYECLEELSDRESTETEISCLMSQLQIVGQQLEARKAEILSHIYDQIFISILDFFT